MKKLAILSLIAYIFATPTLAWASDAALWGTTLGATTGGLIGSTIGKGAGNVAATGAGIFLGAAIGNSIGHSIDRPNSPVYKSYRSYSYDYFRPSFNEYHPTYVAPPAPRPHTIYREQPDIIELYHAPLAIRSRGAYAGPPAGGHKRKGQHCREFTQTIKIDGHMHESYGTACLRPDGSWQIVK